eukprot:3829645-Prymnesium_polylepis.1
MKKAAFDGNAWAKGLPYCPLLLGPLDGLRQAHQLLSQRIRVLRREPAVGRLAQCEAACGLVTRQCLQLFRAHERLGLVALQILPARKGEPPSLVFARRLLQLRRARLDPGGLQELDRHEAAR